MSRPVIITGGGTGGHVFPMRAIADALLARGLAPSDLRFVGSRRGQEGRLLSDTGVSLTLLPGRGIRRSVAPDALGANLLAVLGIVYACIAMLVHVRRWRPGVVVSVGGYASFPTACAAVVWRVPLVLVDFDAVTGLAHRALRRFAASRCVSFVPEGTDARVVVTGTPLRPEIVSVDRSPEARSARRASLDSPIDPTRTVVVVMTGSLGSAKVNDAVSALATQWHERSDVTIVHITGRRDFARVLAGAPRGSLDYRVVEFGDMEVWWSIADVAICRAGAVTIAELTALAIPAILVPLPHSPGDHQAHNAASLAAADAAVVVSDEDCSAAALAAALDPLFDSTRRAEISANASRLGRRDSAERIGEVVLRTRGLA